MTRQRILLADDHAQMLEEVRSLLDVNYEVIGAVENGAELVEAACSLKPDLIVSDIGMPVMNGFEAAAKIRESGLPIKIIFLTVQSSPAYLKKACSLGAKGYVLKVFASEQLLPAVASVLTGETYISPQLTAGASD